MNYTLAIIAFVGFVVAGNADQKYTKELQAHEILGQYGTRLQHCLDRSELEIVVTSKTLNEHQKNWIYEEDMRTCDDIEKQNNPSITVL